MRTSRETNFRLKKLWWNSHIPRARLGVSVSVPLWLLHVLNKYISFDSKLKRLSYFLLEAGDEFKCQKRQFHGTFNLCDGEIAIYCWFQSKKIPASMSLQTKKISLKLYFDKIFIPDLGRNFWDVFPQIFVTFRAWINPAN